MPNRSCNIVQCVSVSILLCNVRPQVQILALPFLGSCLAQVKHLSGVQIPHERLQDLGALPDRDTDQTLEKAHHKMKELSQNQVQGSPEMTNVHVIYMLCLSSR